MLLGACQRGAPAAPTLAPLGAPTQAAITPVIATQRVALPTTVASVQEPIAGAPQNVSNKIALLLSDQKSGHRAGSVAPIFKDRLKELGLDIAQDFILADAGGDAALQQQQAESALEQGAKVLVLTPVDEQTASAIADQAKARRVPVIAYDRLIKNSDGVTLFISTDETQLVRMQTQLFLEGLGRVLRPEPAVVLLFSQTQSEAEKQTVRQALEGKTTVLAEEELSGMDEAAARQTVAQLLETHDGKIDGVYAATDNLAAGAIDALQSAFFVYWPTVTGDGADLAAVQRVLAGKQYDTIYRSVRWQAETAAELAYGLMNEKQVPEGLINASVNNGKAEVPAVLLPLVALTKTNVRDTVVIDGYWTAQQLCTAEYKTACQEAGLAR